jgi:hypothetical protein
MTMQLKNIHKLWLRIKMLNLLEEILLKTLLKSYQLMIFRKLLKY